MNLNALLEKIAQAKILVIGDLMLDHYIWGDTHRISPEAPVPVVHVMRDTYTAGGAANVAVNLSNLHTKTAILGYYSNDEAGTKLVSIFDENEITVHPSQPNPNAPTIIKTRILARNQQMCRIDREASREFYCLDQTAGFFLQLERAIAEVDAVIISDYAKGVVTQPMIDFILKTSAHRPDLLVAVDPKPSRQLAFRGAGLLTPNRLEALQLAGFTEQFLDEEFPLQEICSNIHQKYAPKLLIITLGAEGMAICKAGEVIEILPTEAREVFDVSGAGDTVIATLTAALSVGADPADAARLANAAAGCVVAHMGTVPVNYTELMERISIADGMEV